MGRGGGGGGGAGGCLIETHKARPTFCGVHTLGIQELRCPLSPPCFPCIIKQITFKFTMKRKCYYLPEELLHRLRKYCETLGLKEAEVVRLAIHMFIQSQGKQNGARS